MNTFLPYPDFRRSAKCLDYKRLGKQRIEAWQIYLALTKKNYGWKNHPAVKMWKNYEACLITYGIEICVEWRYRKYKDNMLLKFLKEYIKTPSQYLYFLKTPKWLGNKKFHSAMRSNLLRKDYKYYKRFHWKEKPNLQYYWPIE